VRQDNNPMLQTVTSKMMSERKRYRSRTGHRNRMKGGKRNSGTKNNGKRKGGKSKGGKRKGEKRKSGKRKGGKRKGGKQINNCIIWKRDKGTLR